MALQDPLYIVMSPHDSDVATHLGDWSTVPLACPNTPPHPPNPDLMLWL